MDERPARRNAAGVRRIAVSLTWIAALGMLLGIALYVVSYLAVRAGHGLLMTGSTA